MLIIKTKGKRIEYVLKDYRQKVSKCGIHRELRERMTYEKPSSKRRRMKQKAKRRNNYEKD